MTPIHKVRKASTFGKLNAICSACNFSIETTYDMEQEFDQECFWHYTHPEGPLLHNWDEGE